MREGLNQPVFFAKMYTDVLSFFFFSRSALKKNVKRNKTTFVCRLEFRSNIAKRNRRLLSFCSLSHPKGQGWKRLIFQTIEWLSASSKTRDWAINKSCCGILNFLWENSRFNFGH